MTPAEAFAEALHEEGAGGSDFRLALEAVGGRTSVLAQELGVSQRTVQRWAAWEAGGGKQARNPERSPQAGELRVMAVTEREARALDRLANMIAFDTDEADVDYEDEDEGSRRAQTAVAPLNLRPTVELYRQNAPMSEVGASFAAALGASYGLPENLTIVNVEGLVLR